MPSDERGPNRRVLLVEDDRANLYAMGHMLKAAGFDVVEAESADEAIERLSPASPPACVVLDWLIPGGGDAVVRHVRDNALPTRIVVVTVAYEERLDEISAAKPDAVFRKPFDSAELLRMVTGGKRR